MESGLLRVLLGLRTTARVLFSSFRYFNTTTFFCNQDLRDSFHDFSVSMSFLFFTVLGQNVFDRCTVKMLPNVPLFAHGLRFGAICTARAMSGKCSGSMVIRKILKHGFMERRTKGGMTNMMKMPKHDFGKRKICLPHSHDISRSTFLMLVGVTS